MAKYHEDRPSVQLGRINTRRTTMNIQWTDIKNPLKESLIDGSNLMSVFTDNNNYIPYSRASSAYTGHILLWYILNGKYMSETKGSIIGSVNRFSFGGQYEYMKLSEGNGQVKNPYQNDELTQSEWEMFHEFMTNDVLIKESNVVELAKKLSSDRQTAGMQYLEVIVSEEFGDKVGTICYIRPDKAIRVFPKEGEYERVALSDKFEKNYLRRNPAREVALYPNWTQDNDGNWRTVVYEKEGGHLRYGVPEDMASLPAQYGEYKVTEFILKQLKKNFMPQALIEIENVGLNPNQTPFGNTDEEDIISKIERNFTNDSDNPSSVLPLTRPKGASEAFVHEFRPHTSHKYYEAMLNRFEKSIHKSNHWPVAMMMENTSGFNSNMFMDLFDIMSATKINEHQMSVSNVINTAICAVAEGLEKKEVASLGVKFTSPIQKLIDQKLESQESINEPADSII